MSSAPRLAICLLPTDLRWQGWERLLGPVFRTLLIHGSTQQLLAWRRTRAADRLLQRLADRGVAVEYLFHACSDLLPRRLFDRYPALFRSDEQWRRTPDANLCPSSPHVAEVLAERLNPICDVLAPTTGRHHLWPDDNRPWCFCRRCRELSWSDQNLLYTNMLARALRRRDARATVSYLAYKPAIDPPATVRPEPNVFVQFAPIERDYRHALAERFAPRDVYFAGTAAALLDAFGRRGSTVLEYWLDVSMFSHWMAPRRRIPVPARVMRSDLAFYAALGFEEIATFGAWHDPAYVRWFGDGALRRYAAAARELQAAITRPARERPT
jgi:hypothetical protein